MDGFDDYEFDNKNEYETGCCFNHELRKTCEGNCNECEHYVKCVDCRFLHEVSCMPGFMCK